MTNTRDLIIKLKQVRKEKDYSYTDILRRMKEDDKYLSKSTISRVFSEGSEDEADSFSYDRTILPIANALLDVDNIDEEDDLDTNAMKVLLQSKIQRITELETALDKEKIAANEKLESERERYNRTIDFLKEQIAYKDKRMDLLLDAVFRKDKQHEEMLEKLLNCSNCNKEAKP